MKSRSRLLSILTAVVAIVVIVIILLSQRPMLELKASPEIKRVEINGVSQDFKQGMKVPYDKKLTINASLDGYDFYSKTLDPGKDKLQSLTITLKKASSKPADVPAVALPPAASALQQAAINSDVQALLEQNNLSTNILSSQSLAGGAYTLYAVSGKPPVETDKTLVLVENSSEPRIALGPGTDFGRTSDLPALPAEVITYLKNIGAVHDE